MQADAILDSLTPTVQAHLLAALNSAHLNLYVKDRDLSYVWLNETHGNTLGIQEPADALTRSDRDFFPEGSVLPSHGMETAVIETGMPAREILENLRCPDGRLRSFIITCTPFVQDGSVVGLCGIWTDVTPLAERQQKQGSDEAFFEDLFENAAAISALTDENGMITRVNRRSTELFFGPGSLPNGVIGQNILNYIHKDDRAKVIHLWHKSIMEKTEVNYQVRMTTNDGKVMYLLISGRPILKDGKVVSFLYQALDMIDQKVQEQNSLHAAGIETLGQLAGGFAHDFNNLLTAINGYSEILLNSMDESHRFFSKVQQIAQAGSQASLLTQKILEFRRRNKPELQALDINEELSNQEGLLRHVIKENLHLSIQKAQGLDKVMIDPAQFSKLLLNLLVNAKDAMPGGGEIVVSTEAVLVDNSNAAAYENAARGKYVLLTVRDTGIGMSEEIRLHIFDPFFSTQETGKGIGLWTVSSIVKDAGGVIVVDSSPGRGTTFRILFPVSKETSRPMESPKETVLHAPAAGTRTILVVEDDDTVRDLVREILSQQGHNILTARNGGDALQLARQYEGHIDLLITDMVMRRIDGMMLAKKLHSLLPHIKIMFMSGYGEDVIKRDVIQEFSFLQKPFLPNELLHKVDSLL